MLQRELIWSGHSFNSGSCELGLCTDKRRTDFKVVASYSGFSLRCDYCKMCVYLVWLEEHACSFCSYCIVFTYGLSKI